MHPTRALLFVGAVLLLSCGPTTPPPCGPETCASGCCTKDGECVSGDELSFQKCGRGGASCRACLIGELCSSNGQCAADPDAGTVYFGCDSTNCAGCCAGDECISPSTQTALQCGSGGDVCATCLSGYACQQGACTVASGPDGGMECGKKGQACCANGGCFLGLVCSGGSCVTQTTGGTDAGTGGMDAGTGGTQPVGSACSVNSQCVTAECRILGFPGGSCTKSCTTAADCPSGSTCGADPNDSSGQQKVCLASCATAGTTAGCRTDYVCEKRNTVGGGGACSPKCNSPATCGVATSCDPRGFCCGANGYACCNGTTCDTGLSCDSTGYCKPSGGGTDAGTGGTAAIGSPCTTHATCASNICVFQANGGSPGCTTGPCWPGGYCIADCTSAACPSGSSCSPYLASNSICVQNCSAPGTQSTCRTGYVCDKNWIPGSTQATCIDACNSNADCNSANLQCHNGFCCGLSGYKCCANNTCPGSGTACGADGYCQ